MAQRAVAICPFFEDEKKKWLQNKNNFLKKNILFEKRLKSVSKWFTTDKQYIQNTWKTVIVINEFSYLYFQVKQFLKYPLKNCTE
jgi:hypothetical protein